MNLSLKSRIFRTIVSASTSVVVGGFYGCALNESGITFSDFRHEVSRSSGLNPLDCGVAGSSQAGLQQSICIADAFASANNAFAIYRQQGIDSISATAWSVMKNGRVFRFDFDSDPSGAGSNSNGRITRRECINAQLSGTVDDAYAVFTCQ